MLPETARYVADMRVQIQASKAELEEAIGRFGGNKDAFLLDQIQQAKWWIDDVDTFFLAKLDRERVPARTLADEAEIIYAACLQVNDVAFPQIRKIRE